MKTPFKNPGTALVTGGAKRIGAEIALHLAERGYSIALHYHQSKREALTIAHKIEQQSGQRCEIFKADLNREKEAGELIPNVLKKFPDLSLLINSASIFRKSTFKDLKLSDLDEHLNVNFKAPYILTAKFANRVKNGLVINLLDTHITQSRTNHFNYLLSKKLLASLTRMAALELAPQIRVNAIAPGLILPPANKGLDYLERLAQRIPLKRKGSPTDIVGAVNFLIDSGYMTGQTLFLDGGESLL